VDPGKWRERKEKNSHKHTQISWPYNSSNILFTTCPCSGRKTPLGVGSTWRHVRESGGVVDWPSPFHFNACYPLFLSSSPRILAEVGKTIKVAMPYSPASPEVLKTLTEQYGGVRVVAQMHEDLLRRSASRWAGQHLTAFRLLVEPQRFPVLNHTDEKCAFCNEKLRDTQQHTQQHTQQNVQQNTQQDTEQTTLINTQVADALLSVTPPDLLHMNAAEIMTLEASFF
jgi:hypothetical protein